MLWFTTDVDQIVVQTAHIGVAANNLEDAREAVASGCHDECRGADVDHIVCPVDGGSLTVTITARDESGKTVFEEEYILKTMEPLRESDDFGKDPWDDEEDNQ